MTTFFIGIAILLVGGLLYGKFVEKQMRPTDAATPAVRLQDGVDYVAMPKWKNCLIELLNIAGTGPILGPIQGILFGPIAFITIPIGCILGGALHDYLSGMIAMRNDGAQMPSLVKKYLGKKVSAVYIVLVCLTILLVGAVFIYTPGDLLATQVFGGSASVEHPLVWIIYAAIFLYYFAATVFPIDTIIGKIYPVFGALLLLSSVGVFVGMLVKGYPLDELTLWHLTNNVHPDGLHFFPIFFVTVACGIVSGFHATQSTMLSRTVAKEKDGKTVFFNMMLVEGLIAMIWAAAAMGVYKLGLAQTTQSATDIVGVITTDLLGNVGGKIAVLGVVILAITSGDTALRSVRLTIAEKLHIPQQKIASRLLLSTVIFIATAAILVYAKLNAGGFSILWRYFAWSNQLLAVFTFAVGCSYLKKHKAPYIIALIPGMFYTYVTMSYILNAKIGVGLPWSVSYILGGVLTALYAFALVRFTGKEEEK